ncbi:hypothetical protein CP97_03020 [Aurantiacibacter atlanticus]|uniref:Uncharacterized protein n=1 Tax=Aurantiacibacter atlanticus TaxID=1648404 RepID=A0A0H4VDS5_9SPHN|nr:hypothetical protein CP97_03020 [Aurantiacibacter atlanticus]
MFCALSIEQQAGGFLAAGNLEFAPRLAQARIDGVNRKTKLACHRLCIMTLQDQPQGTFSLSVSE